MRNKIAATIAFIGFAISTSQSMAAPAYLTCDIPANGQQFIVKITADEADGSVSLYIPSTDYSEKSRGAFTADKVIFSTGGINYELDRVNLTIKRVVPRFNFVANGTCLVEKPIKRAF